MGIGAGAEGTGGCKGQVIWPGSTKAGQADGLANCRDCSWKSGVVPGAPAVRLEKLCRVFGLPGTPTLPRDPGEWRGPVWLHPGWEQMAGFGRDCEVRTGTIRTA